MGNNRKSTHILLVEDVKFDREILKEAFKKTDIVCMITECAGAEEVLEQLQRDATKFDVAIVDNTLPGMSGLELAEAIIEKSINLPIIFLTGSGSEEIAIQALKLGVDDYIIKGSKHHLEMLPLLVQKSVERHANYMDHIEAVEELRRSEQMMSLHVMQTPLGVIEWNTNFEVTSWNPAAEKVFGYSKNEALGHHACEIVVTESAKPHVNEVWSELLRMKGGKRSTNENVTKEGQVIICEWYNTPLVDANGIVVGVASLVQDITERKLAEDEVKKSREQLRSLAAHVQILLEEERKRIARNIHDELGQALTVLKFDLSWMEEMLGEDQRQLIEKTEKALELVKDSIQKVQKISSELRPTLLDDLGIVAAMEWQSNEFQNRTGIQCSLAFGSDKIILDEHLTAEIFRVFQEALTNVARHADATSVDVSMKEIGDNLVLKIADNGRGISSKEISGPKSIGLIGMRERIYPWRGELKITGNPGEGTRLEVSVPLAAERREV